MVNRIEEGQRFPPGERKLSKTEIDSNAFDLMGGFRAFLFNVPQFRESLADSCLNITDDESGKDKPSRRVTFYRGNGEYTVEYMFSKNEQNLLIIKDTYEYIDVEEYINGETTQLLTLKETDVITLKSRRYEDQKPISSPMIRYNHPITQYTVNEQHPYVNNAFALQKAREMLAGLSPQK